MEVLRQGLDDWVPFAAVKGTARRLGVTSATEQQRTSLEAVTALAEGGLVEIGEVGRDGFSPSPQPMSEVLARLRADAEGDDADFGYWLNNTTMGDRAARESADAETAQVGAASVRRTRKSQPPSSRR